MGPVLGSWTGVLRAGLVAVTHNKKMGLGMDRNRLFDTPASVDSDSANKISTLPGQAIWLAVRFGFAAKPAGANWAQIYGMALLCGIGFTMSLFIGSLAFEETGVNIMFDERLGIIIGSLISGIAGFLILKWSMRSA